MAYRAYPLHEFGGLRLDAAADEIGSNALDLLNVDLDTEGALRTRDGYTQLGALANSYSWLAASPGTGSLFARRSTTLAAINLVGVETTTTTVATTNEPSSVDIGVMSAGAQVAYTYFGDGVNVLKHYSGGAFGTDAGTPKAVNLAVQPGQNRLVCAGTANNGEPTGGGSASSGSHVWFSDPGAPTTFSANNYVILDPGDGEVITAACSWDQQLFIFKQTKMYVFYGNSTDASGNPVFNYRTVALPTTMTAQRGRVAVGPDGVYFLGVDGLFRTTGSGAVLISSPLWPLRANGPGPNSFATSLTAFSSAGANFALGRIFAAGRRIYIQVATVAPANMLVYDTVTQDWLVWTFDRVFSWLAPYTYSGAGLYIYGVSSTTAGLSQFGGATDNGTAISWLYRTGFYNAGSDFNKRIAETEVWGSGTVDYKLSTDFGSLSSASTLTLGTAPAILKQTARVTKTGTIFSHQFSGSGAAIIHRCVQGIAEERQPGTKS